MSFKAGPSHSSFHLPGEAAGRTLCHRTSALTVCLAAQNLFPIQALPVNAGSHKAQPVRSHRQAAFVQGRKEGRWEGRS